jgi:hypothetical protein
MKKVFIALSAVSILSLGACNNAASKIKEEAGTTNSAANDPAANLQVNQNQPQNTPVEQTAPPVDPETAAAFSFEKESHEFGTIDEGTMAKYDFEFTNTGKSPLIITNAQGSCGCTVPQWPREPIAPGETGKIHVEFNSSGRPGNQTKQVTLSANTVPNKTILKISAQVTPKAKPADEVTAE